MASKKKVPPKAKRDPNKRYYVLADKRPHAERFGITADKLKSIAERMKDG